MIKKILSTKVFKYLVSGGLAFIVDYSVLSICVVLFDLGTGISAASGMSAGILVGFGLNKKWTFRFNQDAKTKRQFLLYLLLVGFNYIFTVWFLVYFDNFIPALLLKPFCAITIAGWNFLIYKHIIFK